MRIPQAGPAKVVRKSSKSSRSSGAGSVFRIEPSSAQSQAAPSTQVASSLPIGDISALLVVQGDDREHQRRVAVGRGYETLDALDALKIDVLSGQVSRQKLVHLSALVDKQRQSIADPGLMNVLDHIELRARVELAKFEQSRR